MEEPLFPFDLYDSIIGAREKSQEECLKIVEMLPAANRNVVRFLIDLFCCYLDHPENQLSAEGFATCIAPSIIRRFDWHDELIRSPELRLSNDTKYLVSFWGKVIGKLYKEEDYPKGLFDSFSVSYKLSYAL